MASSVSHAYGILKGYRTGNPEEAQGFLNSQSSGQLLARGRSESKTNSRPKSYAKKRRMGTRVY